MDKALECLEMMNNGIYPIYEKKLIPEYLSKIPTNKWGLQNIGFQYTTNQNQSVFSIQYSTKFPTPQEAARKYKKRY